jgi:hypothetical protein
MYCVSKSDEALGNTKGSEVIGGNAIPLHCEGVPDALLTIAKRTVKNSWLTKNRRTAILCSGSTGSQIVNQNPIHTNIYYSSFDSVGHLENMNFLSFLSSAGLSVPCYQRLRRYASFCYCSRVSFWRWRPLPPRINAISHLNAGDMPL